MTKTDKELQDDCDKVDFIERCESRFMMALQDVGWQWKTGRAHGKSEYGFPYIVWANGGYKAEGEPMDKRSDIVEVVNECIGEFAKLYADGARFIVWRQRPEFFTSDARVRSWVRFHTMDAVPEDYLAKVSA